MGEPGSTATFSGERFEARLEAERQELLIERLRLALKVGAVIYPGFGIADWIVVPHLAPTFTIIRAVALAILLVTLWLTHAAWGKRHVLSLCLMIPWVGVWGVVAMTVMLGGFTSTYHIGILLICFFAALFFPWSPRASLLYVGVVIVSYFGANLSVYGPTPSEKVGENSGAFILVAALVYFAAVTGERSRRQDLELRMELENANEALKELDRAKSRFFANISHELRTPLTLILQGLRELSKKGIGEEVVQIGLRNAGHLLRLIDDLLLLQRLEQARVIPQKQSVDAAAVIRAAAANFDTPAAGLALAFEGTDEPLAAEVDPEHLRTIVYNLLSNAAKYGREKQTAVNIELKTEGAQLLLRVSDHGMGIPADKLESVFERFTQVDDAATRSREGAGIGLALIRELVELHGGSVQVESVEGEGSCFEVRLPLGSPDPKRLVATQTEEVLPTIAVDGTLHAHAAADSTGPLVLIAEDNRELLYFLERQLAGKYRVQCAENGEEAWRILQESAPDLLITDLMMPGMSGAALIEKTRARTDGPRIPVMVVTARAGSEARTEMLDAGADDYLVKPFSEEELLARVRNLLEAYQQERELSRLNQSLEEQVAAQTHELREMAGVLTDVQEAERARIAHDIHDEMGQLLSALRMELHVLEQATQKPEHLEQIRRIEHLIQKVQHSSRDVIFRLRPKALDEIGLGPALTSLVDQLARYQITVDPFAIEIEPGVVPPTVASAVFRVTQEALTNVVRHSGARRVGISCEAEGGCLYLAIRDDGKGFPAYADADWKSFGGWGLLGIRERVRLTGGQLSLDSIPGRGTSLEVQIPLGTGSGEIKRTKSGQPGGIERRKEARGS